MSCAFLVARLKISGDKFVSEIYRGVAFHTFESEDGVSLVNLLF